MDFSDPDYAAYPGMDAAKVLAGLKASEDSLTDRGYDVQMCLTDFGETAETVVRDKLEQKRFDCIVIGAGIRTIAGNFLLFEKLINVVATRTRAASQQFAEVFLAIQNRSEHLFAVAACFGERGWPLNPDWDSGELASLVDALDGTAKCDDVFVAFYEAENGARIRGIFSDLAASDSMKRWRPIIRQSEDAIERGHHAIIIPALLTVLEGRVFTEATSGIRVTKEIERIVQAKQGDSFERMVWKTISDYVNALFANSDFRDEEPHFNRHWILHGRASADWTRADVIRLLHGVHTIDLSLRSPA